MFSTRIRSHFGGKQTERAGGLMLVLAACVALVWTRICKHTPARKIAAVSLAWLAAAMLGGCASPAYQAWAATTERSYAVVVDPEEQSGSISITMRPATQQTPPLSGSVDAATLQQLLRILDASALKQAGNVLATQPQLTAGTEGDK